MNINSYGKIKASVQDLDEAIKNVVVSTLDLDRPELNDKLAAFETLWASLKNEIVSELHK